MGVAAQRRLVAVGTALLVVFAIWRVQFGADFGDGTHAVTLAMRMAEGDWPLADEMNLQALGSLLAVPFTWVWLATQGVEGVVLASRLWFLVLAFLTGALSYRALRTGFEPLPCFVAVTVMILPTPYSLLVTSYNTVPVLALAVAASAAFAALQRGSAAWAGLSGFALVVSVLAHPAMAPPALVLMLVLILVAREGGRPGGRAVGTTVIRGLLVGALGGGLLVVLALLLGPGLGGLMETLRYTADYQADRIPPGERLTRAVAMHLDGLLAWRNAPALVLAILAGLPRLPARWRGLLAAGAVAALAVAVVAHSLSSPPHVLFLGQVVASFVVLAVVLLLPFLLTVRDLGENRLRHLLWLTAPVALTGFIALSLVSSGSAKWGVAAAPVQPFLGAAVLCVLVLVERHHAAVVALLAALALLGSLLAVDPMRSFRDVAPHRLDARVEAGPLAGLVTHNAYLQEDCMLRTAVADWVDPGDSVFFWAAPAGYAYSGARMDTHNIWAADFGHANAAGLEWMTRTDRWPDVAFVHAGALAAGGGWEAVVARDPIVARLDSDYGAPTQVPGFVVVRRDGTTRDSSGTCPAPPGSPG